MRRTSFLAVVCFAALPATAVFGSAVSPPYIQGNQQNPAAGSSSRAIRISGGVAAGNSLTKVPPIYPPEAKDSGVQGTVVLHVLIDQEGHVLTVTAISGPGALRQSAIDAVSQWTYRPYLLNGQPTAVDTTVTVNFSLNP